MSANKIKIGNWVLDRKRMQIFDPKGEPGNLSLREFLLLEALALSRGVPLSRKQLLRSGRPANVRATERAIDAQIYRIRKKLGNPALIQHVRGVGYKLNI